MAVATAKKRTKTPPNKMIFRDIKIDTPEARRKQHEFHAQPKVFLKSSDNILWPYKSVNGKQTPLPLDLDLSEIEAFEKGDEGAPQLQWLPRQIRYIFGLNSPFADEQDSDATRRDANGQNNLLDSPSNRDALFLFLGEVKVPAHDSVLGNYLWLMNQCRNQHPKARRYGSGVPTFFKVDFGEVDQAKVDLGKLREKAYRIAQTASLEEMLPHASYLNIMFFHHETDEDRDYDAIREDYKDFAIQNPKHFMETSSDPRIRLIFAIKNLQKAGKLLINAVAPGQAHWGDTRKLITVLDPNRDPVEYLAEFCLTKEGEEFTKQIQAYKVIAGLSN